MTSIYLLRHGESDMNVRAAELVGGRSNHAALTALGREQAHLAGRWLVRHEIQPNVILASPAVRTSDTISIAIGEIPGNTGDIEIDPRLQEMSQGVMEGRNRQEVWNDAALIALKENPMYFKFEQGESIRDVQARKLAWLTEIEEKYPNDIVLVGAHGLAIRSLMGALHTWDHARIMHATATPNCSLTLIESTGSTRTVPYIGRDIVAEQLAFESKKV